MYFDITDYLGDFVYDNEIKNGEKITVTLENRDICIVEAVVSENGIEFKIKKIK